jgi:hypothetical protein
MIDIILFFFLFVPMLNMIRVAKLNVAAKLCIILGAIGLFSAWCAKEVTGKYLSFKSPNKLILIFTRTILILEKP